ncbi:MULTISPECIES: pPIWI-associating nuclease domain-containing protein [Chryseobacterium]|uniref:pPIWI-associating nuclease domain-containing protein n=1 Tax=Chryseobacterium TaxID=59732 RepID=UPI0018E0B84F
MVGSQLRFESSENPDKLRHCLISLRTILEYLIDDQLAPIEKIKNDEMFKSEFKKYHQGKQEIYFVKVSRSKK